MSAFNDATCPKCRRRFGWQGKLLDKPPCPRCGYTISRKDLEAEQAEMDRIEAELFGRLEDEDTPGGEPPA